MSSNGAKSRIYTFGYHGWGNHIDIMLSSFEKQNIASRGRGLRWVDIRINRAVRAKGFTTGSPLLKKPAVYRHIKELGNTALAEGKIKIGMSKVGFERLAEEVRLADKDDVDLLLFCHCENFDECHRKTVARTAPDRLKARLYRNTLTDTCEWPPVQQRSIDLTGPEDIKCTSDGYLRIPANATLEGYSSPFTLPAGLELAYVHKGRKKRFTVIRVTPSPDEKFARVLVEQR